MVKISSTKRNPFRFSKELNSTKIPLSSIPHAFVFTITYAILFTDVEHYIDITPKVYIITMDDKHKLQMLLLGNYLPRDVIQTLV
jgi:hypothetical protein